MACLPGLTALDDLLIERDDHKIVALEVKLSSTVDDSDVTHLHWLRDGIAVIPAALLAP